MKIYCIIVTYNGRKWIDYCLGSLRKSTLPIHPIVVDNGSTDDTINTIKEHYPEVVLLPQNRNLGFGQANNVGIEYALKNDATHILLLNQDAAISKDTLEKLLAFDDGAHLLTPIHLNGTGEHIDALFYKGSLVQYAYENKLIENYILKKKEQIAYPISFVNAACWFVPTQIIKKVGGFNPIFFHYAEDNNFIHRLHYHQYGILLISNAFIYHDRNLHGNEDIYAKDAFYRGLLLIETNINFSRHERFMERSKLFVQCMGNAIRQKQFWSFLWEAVRSVYQIVILSKRIRNSRNIEKEIPCAWLKK